MKLSNTLATFLLLGLSAPAANAQDLAQEIVDLQQLVAEMQQVYEQRIGDLEERLSRAERSASNAQRDADEAVELAEQVAIDSSSGASAPNTFNPSIGAILTGGYADVGTSWDAIPGFQPAGEIGTGESGFGIG